MAPVTAPTVGRFVQANIGTDAAPAWRPALVTAVWPNEFASHPVIDVGLNLTVFPDGENDRSLLEANLRDAARSNDFAAVRLTSVPHAGVARSEQPHGPWVPTGPTWRWPPLSPVPSFSAS